MTRTKTFFFLSALAVAVTALVRSRLSGSPPVDQGGWEPAQPSR